MCRRVYGSVTGQCGDEQRPAEEGVYVVVCGKSISLESRESLLGRLLEAFIPENVRDIKGRCIFGVASNWLVC